MGSPLPCGVIASFATPFHLIVDDGSIFGPSARQFLNSVSISCSVLDGLYILNSVERPIGITVDIYGPLSHPLRLAIAGLPWKLLKLCIA